MTTVTTSATYKTLITADLPDFALRNITFRLVAAFFNGAGEEVIDGTTYTMTLDASGVDDGAFYLPTPDNTGAAGANWFVTLPSGYEDIVTVAHSGAAQAVSDLLAAGSTTTDPDVITALVAGKQAKDLTATNGYLAVFLNGQTVAGAGAPGSAALADAADFEVAGAAASAIAPFQSALIPVAPVIALAVDTVTITVSWTYTPVAPIDGFRLYRKTGIGGTYALIASPASGDASYADVGLTADTIYYYRLDAYNAFFTTSSNEPTATTGSLSFDFSLLGDGALPAAFTGATWAISSGKAVNDVTLGAEKLTDPSLEANYTAGKCDTLSKVGLPTLTESADSHTGSKAQQFAAVAASNEVYFPYVSLTAGKWYLGSMWAKRTATTDQGTKIRTARSGSKPVATLDRVIESTAYAQLFNVLRCEATGNSTIEIVNTSPSGFATVIGDDGSLKEITFPTMIASVNAGVSDQIARGGVGAVNGMVGIVARLDSATNPQNFIIGYIYRHSTYYYATLEKCVGGTYTQLITGTLIANDFAWVDGRQLEIRCSGTTISLWYNSTQVGTNQTVSDAGINSNTRFGMISAGGSALQSFFAVAP